MTELEYNYLAHHGILGQRWGRRNGPPYPLDESDHSVAEKKNLSKSLSGKRHEEMYNRNVKSTSNKSEKKDFNLTDQQKKYIKIGAAVAGAALVTAGSIYLAKSGKLDDIVLNGKRATEKIFKTGGKVTKNLDEAVEGVFKKDPNFIHDINVDFKGINPNYNSTNFHLLSSLDNKTPIDRVNCSACTASYELKCRGFKTIAQLVDTRTMPVDDLMNKMYKNPVSETKRFNNWNGLSRTLRKQGRGARGNLIVPFIGGGSHSIAYEVDKHGKIWYLDTQAGGKFKSIKELSNFLVSEANNDPYAGIHSMPIAKWFRTDNLELNDVKTILTLCAGA